MSEYLLLLSAWGAPTDAPSAEQLGGETRKLTDWVTWLAEEGHYRRGGQARTELVVTAEPGDSGSDVGSFLLFEAGDVEAAMAIARSCPVSSVGTVRLLALDAGAGRA